MDIRPLHTEDAYRAALVDVSALVDQDPEPGTPEGDRLEILSILVERYEASIDTAHLLRSPANAAHLERSISQLRGGGCDFLASPAPGEANIDRAASDNSDLSIGWASNPRYTGNRQPYSDGHPMSAKSSIKHRHGEGGEPSWRLYAEAFEKDDVVYLELQGVLSDVVMIDSAWAKAGTVLLGLPTTTAKQLGLLSSDDPA